MAPHSGLRQRRRSCGVQYQPLDWDGSLPYGGKVYLARRKKADSWLCLVLQVLAVAASVALTYWCYYYFDHFHFHVSRAYAHLGHTEAQHVLGQRYLHGRGVEKDHEQAMAWFRKAADDGHPHASYNLAVGHLQGLTDVLEPGEAQKMIKHAADNGVEEAIDMMRSSCVWGDCEDD
ncbi:secretory immunoglobulin A-binding protein EsiB-like [Pollicipes pollicipes]|uniref:secretory immunoglobulin A-binding protein EsiB-like n=1 Tax=Pollicipes pollicipes TaxID=41117 RepID=UPI0018852B9B|nr:secretory immunoglobulin A-binding protein EsiB-like [Pollicipes pollicipes]